MPVKAAPRKTLDAARLLECLQAVQRGNLTARMPAGQPGIAGEVPQGYGSFEYVIPFSSFSMSAPLASAKSITFELNGSGGAIPNVDYQLDRILVITTPVPEPSVAVMLSGLASLGVVAGLRRWRRPAPR